jgi:hypothetical protein
MLSVVYFSGRECLSVLDDVDGVNSDDTVGATNVQLLGVRTPLEGSSLWWLSVLIGGWKQVEGSNGDWSFFGVDVEDGNLSVKGGGQPFELVVESQVIDLGVEGVGSVRKGKIGVIPDLDFLVSSSGGEVSRVGGQSKGVDVVVMSLDGSVELEQLVPDLESSVSSDRGEVWVLWRVRVSDSGDPSLVVVVFGLNLALTDSVPDSEVSERTTRNDLSVVVRESDGVDFSVSGTGESLQTGSVSDIPKSHGLIPRGGDNVTVVVRDGEVGNEVVVTGQTSVWNSIGVSSFFLGEIPDDQSLVSRSGNKDVVIGVSRVVSGDDAGDLFTVAQKEAFKVDSARCFTSHCVCFLYQEGL